MSAPFRVTRPCIIGGRAHQVGDVVSVADGRVALELLASTRAEALDGEGPRLAREASLRAGARQSWAHDGFTPRA
jgi:hypothetical protein